ncbi:helix-turn-helix domain-containing protein [Dapis sp. BLCC M229]
MKARFKYRIYPTPGQKYRLAKLGRLCPRCLER